MLKGVKKILMKFIKFIKIMQKSFHGIIYNIEDLEIMTDYISNNN